MGLEWDGIDVERQRMYLCGPVDQDMVAFVAEQLPELEEGEGDEALVYLCTDGGGAGEGLAVYDLLRRLAHSKRVTTVAMGEVYSSGVILFLAGDTRLIYPHASLGVHGVVLDAGNGPARVHRSAMCNMDQLNAAMCSVMDERTGGDWKEVLSRGEFVHYTSAEALACGLATELVA